ncbi:MAG: rhomboid family intramembrane serine protease [Isosphaeraceae bacterium]
MIFPWGTDAPLYHRPFVTFALIAINTLLLVFDPRDAYADYVLELGDGIHPLQWLTNNFLHSGVLHLLGNMIFLWTFGLVVEGKLGWWRYTIVYLLLAVVESALMQLLVPGDPSQPVSMLGASTAIFGLMGMCLVWAPRNEVTCIIWIRFTPIEFDLSILWFAALYIAYDVFWGSMTGVVRASLTTLPPATIVALALDHTFGAILGMVVAALMLKLGLVDCENWDIFAVFERRTGKPRERGPRTRKAARLVSSEYREPEPKRHQRSRKSSSSPSEPEEDRGVVFSRRLRQHLDQSEPEAALAVYHKARRSVDGWRPSEPDWRDLVEAALAAQLWEAAVVVMRDYVRGAPTPSPRVRLKLAQVLVQNLGKPAQALKVLDQIPEGSLPEKLETIRGQLQRKAEAVREDGPLEIDEDLD